MVNPRHPRPFDSTHRRYFQKTVDLFIVCVTALPYSINTTIRKESEEQMRKRFTFIGSSVTLVTSVSLLGGFVQPPAHRTNQPVVISMQLNNLAPSSPQNSVLNRLVEEYERMHPGVQIKYVVTSTNSDTQQSYLITEASAHAVPDIVWEQYGEVDSGVIPRGLLTDLTPFFHEPNPNVKGNRHWIDLINPLAIPYMKNSQGQIFLTLAAQVATGIFYNKAQFAKAGIHNTPQTWSAWVTDMKKLKAHGFTPFLFADGGSDHCNTSWYERKFSSELLHSELPKFDVNHSQVAAGLDVAVGIQKGIISMSNPAYSEGWKLLASLRPYLAPGGSTYDVCSQPTATTPPLNPESLLISGKVSMIWGGTWFFPQLNELGFKGKYGVFPFPTITKATTPFSADLNVTGTVGGPNGGGEWSVPTQQADSAMTPSHMRWVVNFLQFLMAPQNFGPYINNSTQNTVIPLIKGAVGPKVPGLQLLLPKKFPPITVQGIMSAGLTNQASDQGNNMVQALLNGNMSWNVFSSRFEGVLQQAASQWAQQNKVDLSQYGK